jgi:hypothetical protein
MIAKYRGKEAAKILLEPAEDRRRVSAEEVWASTKDPTGYFFRTLVCVGSA